MLFIHNDEEVSWGHIERERENPTRPSFWSLEYTSLGEKRNVYNTQDTACKCMEEIDLFVIRQPKTRAESSPRDKTNNMATRRRFRCVWRQVCRHSVMRIWNIWWHKDAREKKRRGENDNNLVDFTQTLFEMEWPLWFTSQLETSSMRHSVCLRPNVTAICDNLWSFDCYILFFRFLDWLYSWFRESICLVSTEIWTGRYEIWICSLKLEQETEQPRGLD